ncbi:MAG: PAS domain S-box protein [Acidobacteria bacterium]|nr:PAS domain S-box protein [Acidobacteriota bacterium]
MFTLATISFVIQVTAVLLAFHTIRITGRRTPWTIFCFAVLLIAVHQGMVVHRMRLIGTVIHTTWGMELLNLALSGLLLAGVIWGRPHLRKLIRNRERLAHSEKLRKDLFEQSQDMAFVHSLSKDGSLSLFQNVNEQACRILGYSREELYSMTPEDITASTIKAEDIRILQATGRMVSEHRFRTKDGRFIPVEVTVYYFEQDGRPQMMTFARDISELVKSREAAKEENRRCREILNLTPVSIWHEDFTEVKKWLNELKGAGIEDLRGYLAGHPALIREAAARVKIISVNDATLKLFGVTDREQLLGRLDRLFTEESDLVFMEELLAIWGRNNHFISELSVQTVSGETIPAILEWYAPTVNGELALEQVIVTLSNIGKLKKVEAEKERLSALIEQTTESIMITDLSGNIVYVNRGFEKITGYSAAESLGRNPRFLKSGKTPANTYKDMWAHLFRGENWRGRLYNLRKNGEPYLEEALIFPLKSPTGQVTHYAGVKMDITEKQELEEQLAQSRKMEAIGKLAGGIAHDFNNILTTIVGNAEMGAVKARKGSEFYRHFTEILSSGKRAAKLTGQLLAFSRRQMIKPVILNLNRVVNELDTMLRRLVSADIHFELRTTRDILPILADETQIQQILMNLVVNAYDAMAGQPPPRNLNISTGEVFVDEKMAHRFEGVSPGNFALLEVSDTGCGMKKEVIQHIFEPFYTTKPMGKGTGLGLATVYGILKQNKGIIDVKSSPGLGATFRIYWPIAEDEIEMSQQPEPSQNLKPVGNETILIVEDNDGVRRFAAGGLNRLGYRVISVENGRKAVSLIEEQGETVSLVFTDMIMPEMGGMELAETLRTRFPDIPVLFSTGYTDDFLNGRGNIPDTLIYKPYTIDEVARQIRFVLDRQSQNKKKC